MLTQQFLTTAAQLLHRTGQFPGYIWVASQCIPAIKIKAKRAQLLFDPVLHIGFAVQALFRVKFRINRRNAHQILRERRHVHCRSQ